MKTYFAIRNTYGSATSIGFSNTWRVLVFFDKKERDEFINNNSHNISVKSITKREVGKYLKKPKPFSGQAFCICKIDDNYTVDTVDPMAAEVIGRLN